MKAHLKIFEDTNTFFEEDLEIGKVYTAGRGSNSTVVLDPHPGISRTHLKFIATSSGIQIDLESASGKLISSGQNIDSFFLDDGTSVVSIPPYDFHFTFEKEKVATPPPKPDLKTGSSISPNIQAQESNIISSQDLQKPKQVSPVGFDTDEKTQTAAAAPLEYSLKVWKEDRLLQELELDGTLWNFGREKKCDYTIKSNKASRKHFSIGRVNSKFFVKDLGSSNGTLLNSQQLPANQEIELKSGDFIEIADFKFSFEIKDSNFEKKFQALTVLDSLDEDESIDPAELEAIRAQALSVSDEVMRLPESKRLSYLQTKKKNYLRPILLTLILAIGSYLYFGQEPPGPSESELASIEKEKRLQKEKMNVALDKFNLALRFYNESQYERCIFELDEFFKYDIQTEETADAQELRNQCDIEKERLQRQKDLEIQEEKRLALEKQVNEIIDSCRPLVEESSETLKACLDPAVNLDPANEEIAKLLDIAQQNEIRREEERANAAKYRARVAKGKSLYKKAEDYDKYGDWKRALKAYDRHIASSYPDPGKLKTKSKNNIKAINTRIKSQLNDSIVKAQKHLENGEYKESILAANVGLEVNRDHKELLSIKTDADKQLTTILRKYYQESIIEEDYGEIDEAKIKWKKILESGVEGSDYYTKAQNKLRYYEEGISK